jgi:hypothetical protein
VLMCEQKKFSSGEIPTKIPNADSVIALLVVRRSNRAAIAKDPQDIGRRKPDGIANYSLRLARLTENFPESQILVLITGNGKSISR